MNQKSLYPKKVTLVEVGPRDGLQNEKVNVSLLDKLKYIELLAASGLKVIEAASFVKADKIPQMQDSALLINKLKLSEYFSTIDFPCLVPNLKGLDLALLNGVKSIALFSSTSETFNQKNINASISQSLDKIDSVCKKAKEINLKMRGYISTVFGCPYEGVTSIEKCLEICDRYFSMGIKEISLGDTTGVGNPILVQKVLTALFKKYPARYFALHMHDTYAMALTNITIGLQMGIETIDCSSAGLGGCPYARGASGNVATEDVLYLLECLGIEHDVDRDKIVAASSFILKKIKKQSLSKNYLLAAMPTA